MYLEADGTVSYIYLQNETKLTAVRNLGHYSKLLMAEYNFFPVSNGLLVNLDFVKRYNHSELTVNLTNGKHLYASRRGGQDFRRFLNDNKGKFGNIQDKGLRGIIRKLFGSS